MSIFKLFFGSNKEEKERVQMEKERVQMEKEKEENERLLKEKEEQERLKKELEERVRVQKEQYFLLLKELDSDGNGLIDIVEGEDYGNILKLNQNKIIEINRDYIKQFVQISNYLKTKRKSIQTIYEKLVKCVNEGGVEMNLEVILKKGLTNGNKFECVKEIKNITGLHYQECKDIVEKYFSHLTFDKTKKFLHPIDEETITEYINILKDDIYVYNLLFVQSITMVQSLINNDMITFYEIYEKLDQMNMFDSKHERDIMKLLGELNKSLDDIIKEIREVGQHITSSIEDLSFITEETGQLIKGGLDSVHSSIQINNLLTGIQTYQLYKINKNTKSLRE
jgi:ribosomal protein L7/L12